MDVQVKCTYTYLQDPSPDCQAEAEIEIYFERRVGYPDHDPHAWRILVAPISLCIGSHAVSWTVVTSDVDLTGFGPLSDHPLGKVKLDWPPKPDPVTEKWKTVIHNMGVTGTNGFAYEFYFLPKGRTGKPLCSSDFMHDPTISVTPDPLEPPATR